NALYPLRIIGLNQDTRSDGQGMAGLTFMFMKPVLRSTYVASGENGNFGWSESSICKNISAGGALAPSVKEKAIAVTKRALNANNTVANILTTGDTCFILSMFELGGDWSLAYGGDTGSGILGVGKDRNELYLHFQSLGMKIGAGGASNMPLLKSLGLSDNWLRDRVVLDGNLRIGYIIETGELWGAPGGDAQHVFTPCFCL
ncbi:hypothetical protein, partial [Adlercreutzia murintestinalis]|uniref:hypothetical protein n=1 Tax=Adlercreutzia murintestinalis TaxID=2941325 RepID=UPI00203D8207